MADDQTLYGDFHSRVLDGLIAAYKASIPEMDTVSEGMINTVLLFLRTLFNSLSTDKPYRWIGDVTGEEDEIETGIFIQNTRAINTDVLEGKPVILTRLKGYQSMGTFTGDLRHRNTYHNSRTDQDLMQGQMALVVMSRYDALTRRLADWVVSNIKIFKKVLTFAGYHSIGPKISVSGTENASEYVKGDADTSYIMAQIQYPFTWTWDARHITSREDRKLNGLTFRTIIFDQPVLDPDDLPDGIFEDEEQIVQVVYETAVSDP